MILIYYKTWIYQCLITQVKSPSIYMVSRPGLGSDPSFGSGRDSGRDKPCRIGGEELLLEFLFQSLPSKDMRCT